MNVLKQNSLFSCDNYLKVKKTYSHQNYYLKTTAPQKQRYKSSKNIFLPQSHSCYRWRNSDAHRIMMMRTKMAVIFYQTNIYQKAAMYPNFKHFIYTNIFDLWEINIALLSQLSQSWKQRRRLNHDSIAISIQKTANHEARGGVQQGNPSAPQESTSHSPSKKLTMATESNHYHQVR